MDELRTRGSDRLPDDESAWAGLADQLDTLLLENPEARGFVDVGTLTHARITVVYRGDGFPDVSALRRFDLGWWADRLSPVLEQFVAAVQGNVDQLFWERIYNCKVKTEDVEGSTFSTSNLGLYDVEDFIAIASIRLKRRFWRSGQPGKWQSSKAGK